MPAGRGELQRIAEQVGDHLVQPARIGQDRGRGQLPFHGDAHRLEPAGQAVGRGASQRGQVTRLQVQVQGGRVGRSQVLQVADHARQPQHLIAHRGQLGRRWLHHPVQQCLVPGLQDRNRGAQFVGHVGHQVAADLVLAIQRACHLVERGGQFPQLAGSAHRPGSCGTVPARHSPGHRDEPGDRAGDPPGHHQPRRQGQQRGQPGRPGDGPAASPTAAPGRRRSGPNQ